MVQSLIFDMDGNLFQTEKILEISLEDTFNYLRKLGNWNDITPIEKYREIMSVPLPIVWQALMPNHTDEVRKRANTYFLNKLIENIKNGKSALYPNVDKVFKYLKENTPSIYIASNSLKEYLKAIVDYYHLDKWVTETFSIQQIQTLDKGDF